VLVLGLGWILTMPASSSVVLFSSGLIILWSDKYLDVHRWLETYGTDVVLVGEQFPPPG
jgi:hypothetical protein